MQFNPVLSGSRRAVRGLGTAAILLALAAVTAQGEEKAASATGLPPGVEWKFNLDATWGHFGFGNSLYTNPRPDEPSGDLDSNWSEGSAKLAVSGEYELGDSSQFYGKLSAVGEGT